LVLILKPKAAEKSEPEKKTPEKTAAESAR